MRLFINHFRCHLFPFLNSDWYALFDFLLLTKVLILYWVMWLWFLFLKEMKSSHLQLCYHVFLQNWSFSISGKRLYNSFAAYYVNATIRAEQRHEFDVIMFLFVYVRESMNDYWIKCFFLPSVINLWFYFKLLISRNAQLKIVVV